MGGGCRHMNAWQKDYQGWFGGCNGVKVTDSGTFTLVPFEMSCTGVQYLQVKAPKARPFMRPAGGGGGATDREPRLLLPGAAHAARLRRHAGQRHELAVGARAGARRDGTALAHAAGHPPVPARHEPVDDGNSGLNDAGLAPNQTFTDPAGGLTITPTAVSNSGATIVVTYTNGSGSGPTCIDGSAFTAPGPGMESCTAVTTGAGGTTGAAGTTGAGGRGGSGGRGGAGGTTGGRGGAGGTATGGRGGAGGSTGVAGSVGPGTAGTTGTAGTGDTGTAGAGGTTIPTGNAGSTGGTKPGDRGVSGGCACDTAGSSTTTFASALLMMLGFAVVARRPRARARGSAPRQRS